MKIERTRTVDLGVFGEQELEISIDFAELSIREKRLLLQEILTDCDMLFVVGGRRGVEISLDVKHVYNASYEESFDTTTRKKTVTATAADIKMTETENYYAMDGRYRF